MPEHNEELRAWLKDCAAKVADVNIFVSLFQGDADFKWATEMGFALAYDKPIYLLIKRGTPIPANIKKVATAIEFFDSADDVGDATKRLLAAFKPKEDQ